MTREEARKKAEIMLAYADGKEIEFRDSFESEWTSIDDPSFDFHADCYRIKQEPKYRPFKDAKECFEEMKKHELFGWIKDSSEYLNNIQFVSDRYITASSRDTVFSKALNEYMFADGKPFGIKEEE